MCVFEGEKGLRERERERNCLSMKRIVISPFCWIKKEKLRERERETGYDGERD